MKVVIFCGGQGMRMRDFDERVPKPLVPIGPRPAAYRSSSNYQRSSYSQPSNCRWVQDNYGGRNHSYEVCRGRDGVWRPSGRS